MVAGNIDLVLTQLGWGDGFRIPVANEENKRLEEEVRGILKKINYTYHNSCIISLNPDRKENR